MARRIGIRKVKDKSGRIRREWVDLGPIVPRDPSKKPPKNPHFTIEIHPKHRKIMLEEHMTHDGVAEPLLPEWFRNNPAFTFESSFRKPQGSKKKDQRPSEAADRAKQLCAQGWYQKEAAHEAAEWLRKERGWVDKPGKDVEKTILKRLRQNR